MKPVKLPPIELLREWLIYTPETGEIVWAKNRPYRKNAGKTALSRNRSGYFNIKFNGVNYLAHRVAYALHYGIDPYPYDIDHTERDRTDLRIDKLRLATRRENSYNVSRKDNTSGCNGVTWMKKINKWQASIAVNGERIYLGVYDDIDEAIEARLKAEDERGIFVYRDKAM
jgi:hypothetical protein